MKYHKVTPREIWDKNKLLIVSAVTIITLFFPTGFAHELGHILVCVSNGYDYKLTVGELALKTQCSNTPQPILLYFALGGTFGLISSVMLFLLPIVRKNKGVFIGVSITAFDHFLKTIFETVQHNGYVSNSNVVLVIMSIPLIAFWFVLLWFFSQRSKK